MNHIYRWLGLKILNGIISAMYQVLRAVGGILSKILVVIGIFLIVRAVAGTWAETDLIKGALIIASGLFLRPAELLMQRASLRLTRSEAMEIVRYQQEKIIRRAAAESSQNQEWIRTEREKLEREDQLRQAEEKNRLEREWITLKAERERLEREKSSFERDRIRKIQQSDLFAGCDTAESVKRRYRELLKIYHPDVQNGDTAMVEEINRQYEKRGQGR